MTKSLKNMRVLVQDYNRFIKCISSSIHLLEPPYLSILGDNRTIKTDTNEPIKFIAEKVALKHARPEPNKLDRIEVSIGFLIKYNDMGFNCYYEDMVSSSVNVSLRAIDKDNKKSKYFGFHFDLDKVNGTGSQEQLHPKHHTQLIREFDNIESYDYGNSLHLDIPRFTHFPMDFILGTSFIIANFAPKLFDELRENEDYISIQRKYQNLLWRPYLNVLNNLLLSNECDDFKTAHQLHPYWI